jgi:Tfp pilus assembly protein PilN
MTNMEYVNLLPDTLIKRGAKHARSMRWLLIAVGVLVLILAYSLTIRQDIAAARSELANLEKQVAEKQELSKKLAVLEQDLERAAQKRDTANELLDQPDWAYILADIAEAAQHNAWLEQLTFTKVKVRQKSTDGDDAAKEEDQESIQTSFSAEGYAPSNFELANFMARLERSSQFDNVELNYSELRKANPATPSVMRFEIEGKLL